MDAKTDDTYVVFAKQTGNESLIDSELGSELIPEGGHPPNLPSKGFLQTYFFLMGVVGLSSFFVLLSESDFFNAKYPRYLFYFWSIMPSNIAIPFSFLLMKKLSRLSANTSNIMSSLIMTVTMLAMVIPPVIKPDDMASYLSIMALFFISSLFEYLQNSVALQILFWFPDSYVPIYYFGTGISNLLVILVRFGVIAIGLSPLADCCVLFGFSGLLGAIAIILQIIISKHPYYKYASKQSALKKKVELTFADYKQAFYDNKEVILKLMLSMFMNYIVVPGIMFSSRPKNWFSDKVWNSMVNITVAIADSLGKSLGKSKAAGKIIPNSYILTALANIAIIAVYFTDFYLKVEMVWIGSLVLVFLFMARNGAAESFYFLEMKKTLTKENEEAASTVYNLATLVGLCLGNFVALGIGELHKPQE